MSKEILEITKKFHDTYEKLASEYTYKTREDTKVFDINSNNGKLMYATVNEIVSPILEENKKLKEQLLVTQDNEETFRLEMEDITQILGLDEDALFDDVKAYARSLNDNWNKLKKYIKETKLKEFEKSYGKRYGKTFTQAEIIICNIILDKMQEIEQGSDSNDNN